MKSEKVELRAAESRMVFAGGNRRGHGKVLVKGTKFQLCRMCKFWRSKIYNYVVTIVDNTTYLLKFVNRVDLKCFQHTQKITI